MVYKFNIGDTVMFRGLACRVVGYLGSLGVGSLALEPVYWLACGGDMFGAAQCHLTAGVCHAL